MTEKSPGEVRRELLADPKVAAAVRRAAAAAPPLTPDRVDMLRRLGLFDALSSRTDGERADG